MTDRVHRGTIIQELTALVDDRLRGVQLPLGPCPAQAYRAVSANGNLVLCDRCLDLRRGRGETLRLTGEAFAKELCDDCGKEEL
jgi:hypothetical protein